MQVTGLDHFNIRVPKVMLESLCRFYVDALGLRVGERPPFRSAGFWLYAGDKPLLHMTGFDSTESLQEAARPTGWFNHVAFRCEDLAAARQRLDGMGVDYQVDSVPQLGQTQVFFSDPAGIGVELNFSDR